MTLTDRSDYDYGWAHAATVDHLLEAGLLEAPARPPMLPAQLAGVCGYLNAQLTRLDRVLTPPPSTQSVRTACLAASWKAIAEAKDDTLAARMAEAAATMDMLNNAPEPTL